MELKKNGQLMPVLLELQERLENELVNLIHSGLQFHEAEEHVLPQILLPSEDDEPVLGEPSSPED